MFRPNDLLDHTEDDEDRYFLAEFDLGEPPLRVAAEPAEQRRNLAEYGSIREAVRPTQKYLKQHQSQQVLARPQLVQS